MEDTQKLMLELAALAITLLPSGRKFLSDVITGPVLEYKRFVISTTDRLLKTPVVGLIGVDFEVGIRPVNTACSLIGLRD